MGWINVGKCKEQSFLSSLLKNKQNPNPNKTTTKTPKQNQQNPTKKSQQQACNMVSNSIVWLEQASWTEGQRGIYNSRVSWKFRTLWRSLILDLWGKSTTLMSWKGDLLGQVESAVCTLYICVLWDSKQEYLKELWSVWCKSKAEYCFRDSLKCGTLLHSWLCWCSNRWVGNKASCVSCTEQLLSGKSFMDVICWFPLSKKH